MPSLPLYVKNTTEELICTIESPSQCFSSINKLVVTNYTRDERILNTHPSSIHITTTDKYDKKFLGFAKYLKDRKKAAIAEIGNGNTLYILPPTSDDITTLKCKTKYPTESETKTPHPANSEPVHSASGSDFLSSLLVKVGSTATTIRAPQAPRSRLCDEAVTALKKLEDRIKNNLLELSASDSSVISKAFEPMEREQRFVLYDVLSDFPDLIPMDEGEGVDRHIVVYKKGYEPTEEVLSAVPIHRISTKQEKKMPKRSSSEAPPALIHGDESIVKVNQVKRDRRTIEEHQLELQRKKQKTTGTAQ